MTQLAAISAGILYLVGIFLLWCGATGVTPPGLSVTGVWRILFGVFGLFLLGVGAWFWKEVFGFLFGQRPIRRISERGELRIFPRAIVDLISGLLQREFGLKRPKIELTDESEALKVHIGLHLHPEEDLPGLTDRIRETVAREVERRIGISVAAVDITVHGIAPKKAEKVPEEGREEATSSGQGEGLTP